ncbi:MAG: flavodoxin family protein [Bacteroidaceae bacterium]|nr:flavodoxin family protein [Bacteroidaceae bacterium]
MKALLINGSPHAHGCTYTALSVVAEELVKAGVEAEIVHVGHKDIRGCIGCYKCRELGKCVFDKDLVNEVAKKFEEADGLVIGSPVYYAGPNGTLISFLDRLFFSAKFEKRFKVGAAVVSARRMGTTATLDTLNKYFLHGEMPVAASRYWNAVHGNTAEEVLKDEEGLQTMRVLGRNMAFLIRAIRAERERGGLPEQESQRIATNFIR